jgi:hypothetical protein
LDHKWGIENEKTKIQKARKRGGMKEREKWGGEIRDIFLTLIKAMNSH